MVCFDHIFTCCLNESKLDAVFQYLYYPSYRERHPFIADIFSSDKGPPVKVRRYTDEGEDTADGSCMQTTGPPGSLHHQRSDKLDECDIFMKNINLVLNWGDVVKTVEEHVRRLSRDDSYQLSDYLKMYDNDDIRERIRDLLVT